MPGSRDVGATAKFGGLNMTSAEMRSIDRIVIAASGTSRHARPSSANIRHRGTGATAGSRSSSPTNSATATARSKKTPSSSCLAIRRNCRHSRRAARSPLRRGHRALAIVNVVGSTIARESDGGDSSMHAGPEIGVASTKAFVSTLTILSLLAVHLGRMRECCPPAAPWKFSKPSKRCPNRIAKILAQNDALAKKLAKKYRHADDAFSGPRLLFPIALEGALKLKEISYIHAEGYSRGRNETRAHRPD